MTEREYPRWIHREGHPKDSVVVETAEEEATLLKGWGFDSPEQMELTGRLLNHKTSLAPARLPPDRYRWTSFEGRHDGQIGGFKEALDPHGEWVKWEDVRELFAELEVATDALDRAVGNKLTLNAPIQADEATVDPGTARKGGWPKGKPRPSRQAAVN